MIAAPFVLAAALLAQNVKGAEAAPTVRYVSLPDSYAPDLVPGERLVPGSVYDVVRVSASAPAVRVQATSPQAAPAPAAAPPVTYGSCYASSYGAGATTYAAPAPAPPVTYVIPSYRPAIQSTPMPACNCGGAQYAEPPPSARSRSRPRARMAFGLGVTSEWETRRRNEIHLGRYEGRSAIFSPERWSSGRQ